MKPRRSSRLRSSERRLWTWPRRNSSRRTRHERRGRRPEYSTAARSPARWEASRRQRERSNPASGTSGASAQDAQGRRFRQRSAAGPRRPGRREGEGRASAVASASRKPARGSTGRSGRMVVSRREDEEAPGRSAARRQRRRWMRSTAPTRAGAIPPAGEESPQGRGSRRHSPLEACERTFGHRVRPYVEVWYVEAVQRQDRADLRSVVAAVMRELCERYPELEFGLAPFVPDPAVEVEVL